jgi:adenylate cyclase
MSKIFKAQKLRILTAFGLIMAIGVFFEFSQVLSLYEEQSIDFRHQHFNPNNKISENIVLIDIDEQSLKILEPQYGRWPWPRSVHKEAIQFLTSGEPSVLLFDILFTERSLDSQSDLELAQASQDSGLVSHAIQFNKEPAIEGLSHVTLTEELIRHSVPFEPLTQISAPPALEFHDISAPYEALKKATPHLHFVNSTKQSDGVIRRTPLLIEYDKKWFPSLALRAILAPLKNSNISFSKSELLIFEGHEQKYKIPLQNDMHFVPSYYAKSQQPKTYRYAEVIQSASEALQGNIENLSVNPLELKDKIIIFGTSATGLADLKTTPIGKNEPGVLVHSTAISNILQSHYLKTLPPWLNVLLQAILVSLIFAAMFGLKNIIFRSLLPVGVIALYLALALTGFKYFNLVIPLVTPLICAILSLLDGFLYISLTEGRDKKRLTGTLSKYLSPDVTKSLVEHGIDPTAEVGHAKVLTILFSDIRGFTTLSEAMEAATVVSILNQYLGKMTDVVFNNKGTLDKFIGDAVMAFWGAPLSDEHHAKNAILAALEMIRELEGLNRIWKAQGLPELAIGIGINSGKVIVGNIGSDKRLDYTVIGDSVNLTSRLESLSKYYGIKLVVGDPCYQLTKDDFSYRVLDMVQVKGKTQALVIWEAIGLKSQESVETQKFTQKFQNGFEQYCAGRFESALNEFKAALEMKPGDTPSLLFIDRCEDLMNNIPKEWNGVYIAKDK